MDEGRWEQFVARKERFDRNLAVLEKTLVRTPSGGRVAAFQLLRQPAIRLEQLAASESVLTEDERELGVALVDIGGGTTDIAIYERGSLWHTAVVGVGGDHFTNDIAVGLRMPVPEAEKILSEALKRNPNDTDALLQRSDLQLQSGNVTAADYQYAVSEHRRTRARARARARRSV